MSKPHYRLRCGQEFDFATGEKRLRWWIEWGFTQTQEYWSPCNAFIELKYRFDEAIRSARGWQR